VNRCPVSCRERLPQIVFIENNLPSATTACQEATEGLPYGLRELWNPARRYPAAAVLIEEPASWPPSGEEGRLEAVAAVHRPYLGRGGWRRDSAYLPQSSLCCLFLRLKNGAAKRIR